MGNSEFIFFHILVKLFHFSDAHICQSIADVKTLMYFGENRKHTDR
jgi:hypothetical protein